MNKKTMRIVVINGSPRKNGNTNILLNKVLEGAESTSAQTEIFNLYDLEYKGCIGCLACKVKNGKKLGRCVVNDGLKPVLDVIETCDGLILGSPIYLGGVTAMMRAFLERLIFQYISYDDYSKSYFNGSIRTAFIYTMNVSESMLAEIGYNEVFKSYEMMLNRHFSYTDTLLSTETLQVNDYSKFHMAQYNEMDRKKRREEIFPDDCQKAYDLGKSFCL